MSDRFYAGTRKGLFTVERNSNGWEIVKVDFLGEPATMFLQDPRDGWLYTTLTLGHFGAKLHRSGDGGKSWEECSVPVIPEGAEVPMMVFDDTGMPVSPAPQKAASLSEIWSLETGGVEEPDVLWAGTIPAALYRSTDRGSSWQLVESLFNVEERMKWFGGGKDDAGLHTICVDPRDSRHVTIAISAGGVWETYDAGESWTNIGEGLRQDYVPPDLAYAKDTQDAHRLAFSAADPEVMWVQHHNGVFHSTDGGQTFREIKDVPPAVFGFAVCAHPHDPKTAWFVPGVKDECRVPVDGKLVVTRTRDGGETFEVLRDGLPQEHCYDLVFRHGLDVDASGDRLVLGSSTGGLWVSENAGDSWTCVSNTLPQIYCVRFER